MHLARTWITLAACLLTYSTVAYGEESATELAKRIIAKSGGEARVLTHFTVKDILVLGEKPDGKVIGRTSEIIVPGSCKTGAKDRIAAGDAGAVIGMEFIWGWSLKTLVDPRLTLSRAPDENGQLVIVAVSTIAPDLTLIFRPDDMQLVELRCHKQAVRFSEWKTLSDLTIPTRCAGLDGKGRPWYNDEITEVVPLAGL